jgi:hypothetical protein
MSPKLLNILLVLTPTVLYFAYINPMYTGEPGLVFTPEKSIPVLKSESVLRTNALNQFALIESEVNKISKDYKSIDDETKAKVTMLLPDTLDSIKLRNEVVSIANNAGIALTGLKVTNSVKGFQSKEVGSYAVDFSAKGHYSTLKRLMETYEKSMRLFVLDSVIIQRAKKKDKDVDPSLADSGIDDETLTMIISYRVYYLK